MDSGARRSADPLADDASANGGSSSVEAWTEHAERSLFALANELRRVPLEAGTQRLHLRALELKREVAAWRERPTCLAARTAVLEEIEALAREAHALARTRAPLPNRLPWSAGGALHVRSSMFARRSERD